MKTVYLILTFAILITAPALAQIDPNPDGIGIYADLEGMTNRISLEPNTPLEVYLLMTRPSADGVFGGWECGLVVPDNVLIWGFNFPNDETFAITKNTSYCAVFPRVPFQTVNVLMTFILMPVDGHCAYFYIDKYEGMGDTDSPRYLAYPDMDSWDDVLVDMLPYPGGLTEPAFAINESELATDTVSFGQVKALYR